MTIPLSAPDIHEEDIEAVTAVLRTPHLSLGPKLDEFESSLASYVGASYAIGVSSGTAALHLCMRALGISDGDEVIVPSFTFIAVANAVCYERATPVFVDIDAESLNLDPDLVERAITLRTKAIVVVHTFGVPAEMGRILEIARRHGLFVIEDACEAIGAEYRGQKVGTFGHVGVFGFYPNKQITTGEGGAIVTNDPTIAAKVRSLGNQGRVQTAGGVQYADVGYNYRISEIQCALGISQLKRIDSILNRRESIARRYHEVLSRDSALRLPRLQIPDRKTSWFVYVLRLNPPLNASHRNRMISIMKSLRIETRAYFSPVHLEPPYRAIRTDARSLPVTESSADCALALPFFNRIEDDEINVVGKTVCSLVQQFRPGDTAEKSPGSPP
jgi:dTDP-4-amino-4,6-dideoxygalactose transaminase